MSPARSAGMREYARAQTAALLRRLAFEVNRCARSGEDAEVVHDLRVAIRRLSRCLRVFAQFYPGKSWKKLRAGLKKLMKAAGEVRDREIALDLLTEAGVGRRAVIVKTLEAERQKSARALRASARQWKKSGFFGKWAARLELQP